MTMTHHTHASRRVAAVVGIVSALAVVLAVPRAFARDQERPVVPPEVNVFGRTYGEWSATWWQWLLSIPAPTNPTLDPTGQHCDVGQLDLLFFLAGAPTSDAVMRACTVPSGRRVLVPIITAECSTVEPAPFHGDHERELRACAKTLIDGVEVSSVQATIDGKAVEKLRHARVQSPVFDFIMPGRENFLGLPGVTSGSSVADGYWLILEPLAPGDHVLHFEATIVSGPGAGFSQDVTYTLTVQD
jgi:hypothetical protein